MQNDFQFEQDAMEDISSSSPSLKKSKKKSDNPITAYGNGIFKNLSGIIKAIAFIIAFFIIAVSFVLAYFLFSSDKLFMAISLGILIFGTAVAAIVMFLIYAIGHLISQNNEILKKLDDLY